MATELEICCFSVADVQRAQAGGASRVELCAGQPEGGTTPSLGYLEEALTAATVPVFAMVRERGGSFCYDDFEFAAMRRNVALVAEAGCAGVVFGILDAGGRIDLARNRELLEIARALNPLIAVTFHRAFDVAVEPLAAYAQLCELGFDRVLTSGQAPSAIEGAPLLAELVALEGPTQVMPGGGVRPGNAASLLALGVRNLHSSASVDTRQTVSREVVDQLAQICR